MALSTGHEGESRGSGRRDGTALSTAGFVDSLKREGCPDVVVSEHYGIVAGFTRRKLWPGYTGYVVDIRAGQ